MNNIYKEPENAKAIPVKVYDFQVDFKLDEKEVVAAFLNPKENKNIRILKRPQTAKVGTFGSPYKTKTRKQIIAEQKQKEQDTKLVLIGVNNPPPANDQYNEFDPEPTEENPEQAKPKFQPPVGVPSNIFHFTNSLPVKRLAENPKLAMGMIKKKTLGTKSQKVLKGIHTEENHETHNQETALTYSNIPESKSIYVTRTESANSHMKGLPPGKKMTVKALSFLQKTKEVNAGKSSGMSVTFDKYKKPVTFENTLKAQEKQKPKRPFSAHVAAAINFMKKLTTNNRTERDSDDEVEAIIEEMTVTNTKGKVRPQSANNQHLVRMKEFKTIKDILSERKKRLNPRSDNNSPTKPSKRVIFPLMF